MYARPTPQIGDCLDNLLPPPSSNHNTARTQTRRADLQAYNSEEDTTRPGHAFDRHEALSKLGEPGVVFWLVKGCRHLLGLTIANPPHMHTIHARLLLQHLHALSTTIHIYTN